MKKSTAFTLAGAGLGLFFGSSMGIAAGGSAYNAAVFLTPLGGFVGWLIASRNGAVSERPSQDSQGSGVDATVDSLESQPTSDRGVVSIVHSALAIMAALLNFHIEVLRGLGLLSTFSRQPLLFFGLVVIFSAIFPPFFVIYFCAWLGANHFGLSAENEYRVNIK